MALRYQRLDGVDLLHSVGAAHHYALHSARGLCLVSLRPARMASPRAAMPIPTGCSMSMPAC